MEVGSVGVVGVAGGVVGGLTNGGCPANSSAISAILSNKGAEMGAFLRYEARALSYKLRQCVWPDP